MSRPYLWSTLVVMGITLTLVTGGISVRVGGDGFPLAWTTGGGCPSPWGPCGYVEYIFGFSFFLADVLIFMLATYMFILGYTKYRLRKPAA